MLIDSHCHLDFPDFDEDRDSVVARAAAVGVDTLVTISTRVAKFAGLQALTERYDRVFCSVGTHPHNAAEEPDVSAATLIAMAEGPKVVADRRGRPRLPLRHRAARGAAAKLPRAYRGGPRDAAAARHPCARRGRGHGDDPRRGDGEGGLPGHPPLLLIRPGSGHARPGPRIDGVVFRDPDVQELSGTP